MLLGSRFSGEPRGWGYSSASQLLQAGGEDAETVMDDTKERKSLRERRSPVSTAGPRQRALLGSAADTRNGLGGRAGPRGSVGRGKIRSLAGPAESPGNAFRVERELSQRSGLETGEAVMEEKEETKESGKHLPKAQLRVKNPFLLLQYPDHQIALLLLK